MKCDDYLSNSTTGGRWARWRARIHAARCPRCAAVRAFDAENVRQNWVVLSHSPRPNDEFGPRSLEPSIAARSISPAGSTGYREWLGSNVGGGGLVWIARHQNTVAARPAGLVRS